MAHTDAVRHLSTKVLWPQPLVKRGVVVVGTCTSTENCTDLKSLLARRLRQLRQWNGLVLDRSENSVTGRQGGWTRREREQQGAAVPEESLETPGNVVWAIRGAK